MTYLGKNSFPASVLVVWSRPRRDGRFSGLQFIGGQTLPECLSTVKEENFKVGVVVGGWYV